MFRGCVGIYEPEPMQDFRSGAHAVVLRARVLDSADRERIPPGMRVAIKRPRSVDGDPTWLRRERDRLILLSSPPTPGVVEILDWEPEGEPLPFVVMPWYDFDQESWKKARKPSIEERLQVLMQVITGLFHLHRAPRAPNELWIHRDLKPQNILIREVMTPGDDTPTLEAVIADLSILKSAPIDGTTTQSGVGTRHYAPPGALLGRRGAADPTVDSFALAVITFEMFTDQRPDVAIQQHLLPAGRELANLSATNELERRRFQERLRVLGALPLDQLVEISRYQPLTREEEALFIGALRLLLEGQAPESTALDIAAPMLAALRPMLEADPRKRSFGLPALFDACQRGLDILERAKGRERVRIEGTRVWELELNTPAIQGGQALVMRARAEGGGPPVAAKITRESGELALWLENERQMLERLGPDSGVVPRLLDHGRTPVGRRFLILEWFPYNLRSWLRATNPPLERRVYALTLALEALDALPRAVRPNELFLHRDLKPENLLVAESGATLRVVLADLGCGVRARMSQRTWSPGAFSPPYAPPEQWLPLRMEPREGIDLYAMGVVIYEVIVGTVPDAAMQRQNALNEDGARLMELLKLGSTRTADDEQELRALGELRSVELMWPERSPPLTPRDIARLRACIHEHLVELGPNVSDSLLDAESEKITSALLAVLEPALRVDPEARVVSAKTLRGRFTVASRRLDEACEKIHEANAKLRDEDRYEIEQTVVDVSAHSADVTVPRVDALPLRREFFDDTTVGDDERTDPFPLEAVQSEAPALAQEPDRTVRAGQLARRGVASTLLLVLTLYAAETRWMRDRAPEITPPVEELAAGIKNTSIIEEKSAEAREAAPSSADVPTVATPPPADPPPADPPPPTDARTGPSLAPNEQPKRTASPPRQSGAPKAATEAPLVLSWPCGASGEINGRKISGSPTQISLSDGTYHLVLLDRVGHQIEHQFALERIAKNGVLFKVYGDFIGSTVYLTDEDVRPSSVPKRLEFKCP